MSPFRLQRSINLVVLLAVTLLMIVLYGRINYTAEPFAHWDLSLYRKIASASPGIAPDIVRPFAYRILGPYIVGLLPLPDPLGFYVLAIVSSVALVFLFYRFLRYAGLSRATATVAVILFTFNSHWFGFMIWDYFQIGDLLSLVFIVLLFRAMLQGRWALFGAVLILGALTRETSLLTIPVAFVYLLEKKHLRARWRKAVVAVIPGLAVFFLVRLLFPAEGGRNLWGALVAHSGRLLSPEVLSRLLFNSYLPFCFIPLVFYKTTVRFFRTRKYALVFFILVFLSTMFGSNNERLMAPAFIVVYALIGIVIQGLRNGKAFTAILIGCGFLSSLRHSYGRYPLPNETWTYLLSLGSLLIVTVAAILERRKKEGALRPLT